MITASQSAVLAATILLALALGVRLVSGVTERLPRRSAVPRREPVPVTASRVAAGATASRAAPVPATAVPATAVPATAVPAIVEEDPATARGFGWYGDGLIGLALACLTAGLVTRMLAVGHGPFADQYEFAVSFAWGMLGVYGHFAWRHGARALALLVLPLALGMLLYAAAVGPDVDPLVPALRNEVLLTLHVLTAVLAYGAAAVACAAGVLYLILPRSGDRRVTNRSALDALGYRAVVISFPLMTLMIALGAVWADIAWGTYWSWDPKETASLVTWLIYGAYLHARTVRGWRGRRSAWLLVLGFAAVLFTYFGNLFFGGMHSYA